MTFKLPDLPYAKDALQPHISAETLDYHYGKHHQAYVNKLNELIPNTEYESLNLATIITTSAKKEINKSTANSVFNNAAQVWNHTFYWHCLAPKGGHEPTGKLADAINKTFGSFEEFKDKFSKTAVATFGSGWAWLVKDKDGKLQIVSTSNAGTPMADGQIALLTCDVWEHAYYVDYRNARPKYVEAFWNLVNWDFVKDNLA
ncbi:MAG: superoxide dismutase [Gammaproteobacteria bacterium]|jgi:Fe-Mn family superoxide dismutase|nr:superoxide dismutase [Gammaproteobacteria bacterium]